MLPPWQTKSNHLQPWQWVHPTSNFALSHSPWKIQLFLIPVIRVTGGIEHISPHFLLERRWLYIFNGGRNGIPHATKEIAMKCVQTVCASMCDCVLCMCEMILASKQSRTKPHTSFNNKSRDLIKGEILFFTKCVLDCVVNNYTWCHKRHGN